MRSIFLGRLLDYPCRFVGFAAGWIFPVGVVGFGVAAIAVAVRGFGVAGFGLLAVARATDFVELQLPWPV